MEVESDLVRTGIAGLDDVLRGGLVPHRLYLVEGDPGSGKTTLSTQFLLAGVARGEPCLFVTLSETADELKASARSHGFSFDGIEILEIIPSEEALKPDARYTMYHPSEVELGETIKTVFEALERVRPARVVFDSLSELRLLSENPLRYRRQILALKQRFVRMKATVLVIDDRTGARRDLELHSLAHGVISLEHEEPDYGPSRRRLKVHKIRGRSFVEGLHDFRILHGGLEVYPRLVASEHRTQREPEEVKSGVAGLDDLLGGGFARCTSTLIMGAAGTGKSSIATQCARAAAERGEHASIFLFDESIPTFLERSRGLGMGIDPLLETGRIDLRQVDPAELSPGEFAHAVRRTVDENGTRLVVIDSLTGYMNSMPSERLLLLHLHELLAYLAQRGVTTLLILTQHGLTAADAHVPLDASYLADTVVLLRYFEAAGEVRQAISVIKKRTGRHERTIRELQFDKGIAVGETLRGFRGVLSGTPVLVDPPVGREAR